MPNLDWLNTSVRTRQDDYLPLDRPCFVLRLRYPHSGLVQEQRFEHANRAIQAAYAHFASFPAGLAQISDETGEILHPHSELSEMYKHRIR